MKYFESKLTVRITHSAYYRQKKKGIRREIWRKAGSQRNKEDF